MEHSRGLGTEWLEELSALLQRDDLTEQLCGVVPLSEVRWDRVLDDKICLLVAREDASLMGVLRLLALTGHLGGRSDGYLVEKLLEAYRATHSVDFLELAAGLEELGFAGDGPARAYLFRYGRMVCFDWDLEQVAPYFARHRELLDEALAVESPPPWPWEEPPAWRAARVLGREVAGVADPGGRLFPALRMGSPFVVDDPRDTLIREAANVEVPVKLLHARLKALGFKAIGMQEGGGNMNYMRSFPEWRLDVFLHTAGYELRNDEAPVRLDGLSFGRTGDELYWGFLPDSLQLRVLPERFWDDGKQAMRFLAGLP